MGAAGLGGVFCFFRIGLFWGVSHPFWSWVSVGVRDRDGCRLPWGGLVLGERAAPFRFGGFHVLVQHPICSV